MSDLIKNIKENGTASSALLPQVIDNVAIKKQIKIFIDLNNQQYRIDDNAGGAIYEEFIKALESDRAANYKEFMDRLNEFGIELAIGNYDSYNVIAQRAAIGIDLNGRCSAMAITSAPSEQNLFVIFVDVSFIDENGERVFELIENHFNYNTSRQEFSTHKNVTDLTTFERIY